MKDFLGKEINIGDQVVLTAPRYRHFVKATVIAFTPKQVRVEFLNTWNYGPPGRLQEYLGSPDFLIVINNDE